MAKNKYIKDEFGRIYTKFHCIMFWTYPSEDNLIEIPRVFWLYGRCVTYKYSRPRGVIDQTPTVLK